MVTLLGARPGRCTVVAIWIAVTGLGLVGCGGDDGTARSTVSRPGSSSTTSMAAVEADTNPDDGGITAEEAQEQRVEYAVTLRGPTGVSVPPGATTTAEATIRNVGDRADRYAIDVSATPLGVAVRVDPAEVDLEAGASVGVRVRISATSEASSGQLVVTAASRANPRISDQLVLDIRVG